MVNGSCCLGLSGLCLLLSRVEWFIVVVVKGRVVHGGCCQGFSVHCCCCLGLSRTWLLLSRVEWFTVGVV
jgi:hypothetical protein